MQGFFPPLSCLDIPPVRSVQRVLIVDGQNISFRSLYQQACSIAGYLEKLEIDRRFPVAVQAGSNRLHAWMLYAARVYGIPLLPLGMEMTAARRDRLLQDVGCKNLITDIELTNLPADIRLIAANKIFASIDQMDFQAQETVHDSQDVQLILATSGSEGDSKGVMLSGENLEASAKAVLKYLDLKSDDLWLCCLPLNHVGGISILYRCLYAGAAVLIRDSFTTEKVWQDLHDNEVTHISLVPAMLASLLEYAQGDPLPDSLRSVLIGGGPLAQQLASQAHDAGWPICVSYGMSETASMCVGDNGPDAGIITGSVGSPMDGIELSISEQGRICIRGAAVMLGYASQGMSPGAGLHQDGWFVSGDMGELDSSGRLRVLGRADDILVSGGRNIHPQEVESMLTACPGVVKVAVTGMRDEQWGDILVALYTGDAAVSEVETWSRKHVPSALRPRSFHKITDLPLNHMGKLERSALSGLISRKE